MRNLIAASILSFAAVPMAASAETIGVGCGYGEMTIERLAEGNCMSRIPTPLARPDVTVEKNEQSAQAEPESFRYIQSPNPRTGAVRTVRIAGPVYLPDDNDGIEFERHASIIGDPLNAVFSSFASALGIGSAQALEAKTRNAITIENVDSQMERLVAGADIRILAAHNN